MEYIPAKTIVTKTKDTSWFGIDYNMNIYRGCSHGCIYCDSRSSCFRVVNFDTVKAKKNALVIIRDDLRRKVRRGVIGTGAMSDPYNPFEKELQLTRHALELVNAYEFGIAIDTKGSLVSRDIDILSDIKKHSPTLVKITITTSNSELAKKIEPRAPSPKERFQALEDLSVNNIYAGILMSPLLPFITDSEENIKDTVKAAYDSGAKFVYSTFSVTQRDGQREYFHSKLKQNFSEELADKYRMSFTNRYACVSPNAKKLYYIFANECDKYGLLHKISDITAQYKQGYGMSQLSFL